MELHENIEGQSPHTFFQRILLVWSTYKGPIIFVLLLLFFLPLIFLVLIQKKNNTPLLNESKIPKAQYVADELLVVFKDPFTPNTPEIRDALNEAGVVFSEPLYPDNTVLRGFYVLQFKKGTDIAVVKKELEKLPGIDSVDQNHIVKGTATVVNDTLYDKQWDMVKIRMPEAWDSAKGSKSVTVAVLDTGIDFNHEDFKTPDGQNVIVNGGDMTTCNRFRNPDEPDDEKLECVEPKARGDDIMDANGHGTHVAGTIGAVTNNTLGVAGINWQVRVMGIKILGNSGFGSDKDIIAGIIAAADKGAQVINMSLGGPGRCSETTVAGKAYLRAIEHAKGKNAVVIVAAGNDGIDAARFVPASCKGVIVVGATKENDTRAGRDGWGSNWGAIVTLSAPGQNIWSTRAAACSPTVNCKGAIGNYVPFDGTSMATPHVAGVVALLLSKNPSLSPDAIKECLIRNVDPITTDKPIGGRLNALKMLQNCAGGVTPPAAGSPTPAATPGGTSPSPTSAPPAAPGRGGSGHLVCYPEGGIAKRYDSDTLIVENRTGKELPITYQHNWCDYKGVAIKDGDICNIYNGLKTDTLKVNEKKSYKMTAIPACKNGVLVISTVNPIDGGCWRNDSSQQWSGGTGFAVKANPSGYPSSCPTEAPKDLINTVKISGVGSVDSATPDSGSTSLPTATPTPKIVCKEDPSCTAEKRALHLCPLICKRE